MASASWGRGAFQGDVEPPGTEFLRGRRPLAAIAAINLVRLVCNCSAAFGFIARRQAMTRVHFN